MKKQNVSIIIPTFKRELQINKILNSLRNQLNNSAQIEILICDSFSKYKISYFPRSKNNFTIKYFNINQNVLSTKRNFGISKAKYKNIILLDDDCIPDKNFLKIYLNDFKEIDEKTIISGVVDYPTEYIKKYNHVRYRGLKHFKAEDIKKKVELRADKIVAMNMGFINSKKINKIRYFDERFIGYGFEDYEFGFRLKKNGFKLLKTKARIIHEEGKPDIKKYIKKYYHLGRDGMKNLLLVDKISAKKTIYFKIENFIFFKLFTKLPKFNYLLLFMEKLIVSIDKYQSMYFSFLYSFLRLSSYTRGFIDRSKSNLSEKNKTWYE
jgi:glycosyltransferase involved in cell wall biosynthesis